MWLVQKAYSKVLTLIHSIVGPQRAICEGLHVEQECLKHCKLSLLT